MTTGRDFSSDNAAPAHPKVLEALAAANAGNAPSYGDDPWTARLKERMSELFGRPVWTFPVLTGTAANTIALASMTPPCGAILCHEAAHILVDECGGTELLSGGARLIPLPGEAGRIDPAALEAACAKLEANGFHNHQPAALSLTQATESGTVYPISDIKRLTGIAHARSMQVHMDGARLANAIVRLGCSPAAATIDAGVDALSFGATKNGAAGAEAIVFFDGDLAERAIFLQKRVGHVPSKMRFISAQILAILEGGLWLENARTANAMAARLAAGLRDMGLAPRWPIEINEVFIVLARASADRLRAEGFQFLTWGGEPKPGEKGLHRFVMSFATEADDVDRLLAALASASRTARA